MPWHQTLYWKSKKFQPHLLTTSYVYDLSICHLLNFKNIIKYKMVWIYGNPDWLCILKWTKNRITLLMDCGIVTPYTDIAVGQQCSGDNLLLMALSHYPNQCWLIVSWNLGNKLQWIMNIYEYKTSFQKTAVEDISKMPVVLFRT